MPFGLLDQLLTAGANFALNLFLAGVFLIEQYGAFATVQAGFFFLLAVHQALISEPLMVLGPKMDAEARRGHRRSALRLNTLFSAIATLLGLGVAWALEAVRSPLGTLLAGQALATPFLLLLWLLRRAAYTEGRAGLAALGSAAYAVLLGATVWLLAESSWLTPFTVFIALSAASLAGCSVIWWGLERGRWGGAVPPVRDTARQHWGYGRWVLGASVAHALGNTLYVPLVGALAGLAETGVLRASQNLLVPLQQLLTAASSVYLPWAARQAARPDPAAGRADPFLRLCVLGSVVYGAALVLAGRQVALWAYGDAMVVPAGMLPALAAWGLAQAAALPLSLQARAAERSRAVLISKGVSALGLALGVPFILQAGAAGAAGGLALSGALEAFTLMFGRRKRTTRRTA